MRFVSQGFRFSLVREPYTKKLIGDLVDMSGKNRFGTLFCTLVSDSSFLLEFLFLAVLDGQKSHCVHYLIISHFFPDSYS
jgi:hypothetical protein